MHNRRTFLKYSAVIGAGVLTMPSCMGSTSQATGIQLYTLRDEMGSDPKGTLKKIADIGYKEVESAGYGGRKYYGFSASEFKKILDDTGLNMVSGHYMTGRINGDQQGSLSNGWEQAVEDAATAGQKYMVVAYLVDEERKSLDDYKSLTDLLNKCGETCKKSGIQLCYHNHDFEFKSFDGTEGYDVLLNDTDEDLLKMELDLFWATKADKDPVKLFEAHKGRFPLWHVKDMDADGNFAAVGTGSIDFKRIFDAAGASGMKHYFVEQDVIKGDHIQTITTSYKNVQKIIS
ncbi:sugar phosphate isomerase/epimerase family protein [Fulvivirga ligni]|uniref:sugar phosphate isomerase/epimerase family protein n=1 Tax=Fulvivirga ligni TaxID=2904246 RepID=UPI001F453E01|nr:TIM barrel protein [Fulvivirga ligni]UII24318.1 TIM barrel protein [Fulvivirga ligni]